MISMMICHFIIVLSCSSMVVLGVELSCNQSSTTCPGDVVQCECQVTSSTLGWLSRDLQSEEDVSIATLIFLDLGMSTSSGPYTATLCSVDSTTLANTLTSKLTVTLANTVVVTCRRGNGDINTTRLTVAGKLSSYVCTIIHS